MTPIELFDYDINGYVYIEHAVESDYLEQINNRMDEIEDQVVGERGDMGIKEDPVARFDDINQGNRSRWRRLTDYSGKPQGELCYTERGKHRSSEDKNADESRVRSPVHP